MANSPALHHMAMQPLYPNRYVWFVFMSAMDVFMTFLVLSFGGTEANSLANWVLKRWGLAGMTWYKFLIVVFVILLCEYIGRHNERAGGRLANYAIIFTCFPVLIAFGLLFIDLSRGGPRIG